MFNLSNEPISNAALIELERDFATLLETPHKKITVESNATVTQTIAFDSVGRMASRISGAAKASGLRQPRPQLRLDRTVRLLRGRVSQAGAAPEMALAPAGIAALPGAAPAQAIPSAPDGNGNGSGKRVRAQRTIASVLSNLDVLLEQVLSIPNYRPNEGDLTPARVGEWIAYLRRTRNTRLDARASTENTRQERDDFLIGTTGLGVRMRMLKMYINSILDPNDDRRRRIRSLRFVFQASNLPTNRARSHRALFFFESNKNHPRRTAGGIQVWLLANGLRPSMSRKGNFWYNS